MVKTVFEMNGTTLIAKPVGELDSTSSPVFEEELRQRLPGVGDLIVDFEKVGYISSAGLRVLLVMEQYMEDHDTEMKLIHVNEHIMEIFDMVGFLDVVTVE
ncbi:MAG: STAS domain-containing protein [Clostridia bacterium]|nr:STAS domain-containing protein [Clostridia bacterium]